MRLFAASVAAAAVNERENRRAGGGGGGGRGEKERRKNKANTAAATATAECNFHMQSNSLLSMASKVDKAKQTSPVNEEEEREGGREREISI